jgi:hypothetical protein
MTEQQPTGGHPPEHEPSTITPPPEPSPAAAVPTADEEPTWEPIVRPPAAAAAATGEAAAVADSAGRSRSVGLRWAIALGAVALVVAATAVIVVLASGRPATSVTVGYMAEDTIAYSEVRLDLPGDQRAKLASFMSSFPGFKDQAQFDPKLDEALDRIVRAATKDGQTWSADIKPWFGGQIAVGSSPADLSPTGALTGSTGNPGLFVVTIRDRTAAIAWLKKTVGGGFSESDYNGATVLSGSDAGFGTPFAFAVTDSVILAGADADVRAAVDSKGGNKLADDAEFKAAFGTVKGDYVAFSFIDYQSLLQSTIEAAGAGSGLASTTVDEELLAMVPTWIASVARIENDAIVTDGAFPSIDFGYGAQNKHSGLAGHAPAGSIFYAESHDIGAATVAFLDRLRQIPELRQTFGQIDQSAGMIGGVDGAVGWWGDVALAIAKDADGNLGGGLLIAPTDAEKAGDFFDTIRSFVVLGGRGMGVSIRDVQHGATTISIVDFSGAVGQGAGLPPGFKPELAFAVTNDVVVLGYGESFVGSVLDANGGTSLAGSARYQDLLKRVGDQNLGLTFVDVAAVRTLVEPLVKTELSGEDWAFYEREIKPYLLPFDAIVSSAVKDGGVDHLVQSIVVKPAP